jgi:hypothetical protein
MHRATVSRQPANIASLFSSELVRRIHDEDTGERADSIKRTIKQHLHQERALVDESRQYYSLCERAWLRWSRHALDYIARRALQQATTGPYTPSCIENARDAAEAHARCAMHIKVLDHASRRLNYEEWALQLEAARHVHESTRHALAVGATLENGSPADAGALHPGLMHAADALAACIDAGFVIDSEREVRDTLWAMQW